VTAASCCVVHNHKRSSPHRPYVHCIRYVIHAYVPHIAISGMITPSRACMQHIYMFPATTSASSIGGPTERHHQQKPRLAVSWMMESWNRLIPIAAAPNSIRDGRKTSNPGLTSHPHPHCTNILLRSSDSSLKLCNFAATSPGCLVDSAAPFPVESWDVSTRVLRPSLPRGPARGGHTDKKEQSL
jgi:hypothetical protein